ncbi:hypothetical protein AbraIFM66951_010690 [Aspergillus brasiliensis]|uniref:Alcohol dehydrogenase iron-type/glycerol dehydrogenase GldA domain-containing protein n=1 Tax=Aspergillus brasiliensis TaxID=319629 RepID=A0A9W5YXS6_9EURO|nr:hypothetical protein AbraCBS73388_011285 [Aspergillus brasiliensis]GKZ47330.1 hypothetical protein AbraIFM66951_010690 [Aspergillus brasiliensis]
MSQSHTLSGHWQPNPHLQHLYYGPDCVSKHLLSSLPNPTSKAIIITGTTLATRTPLVQRLQTLLSTHHAATISSITQHTPSHTIDAALHTLLTLHTQDPTIDTLISLGGGSPIDAAKILALKFHLATTNSALTLTHLAIPTTLSAAETTPGGSTTQPDGTKTGIRDAKMAVHGIFYDPVYTKHTPMDLWLSTGIRALDHAVEAMYHPTASEVPWKVLAIYAVRELFECLPKVKDNHMRDNAVTVRLMLASFASSGLKGEDLGGAGMGLSHSLGYALGSPYGIPHGVTSCVTLGKVVGFMAGEEGKEREIARLVEAVGGVRTGDDTVDARVVGEKIVALVEALGLGVGSLEEEFGVCRDEVPVIVKRALRGVDRGEFYDRVEGLVRSFF